jgi:hypothetical protein
MSTPVEELYLAHIKPLPMVERLRLLEMTARDLVTSTIDDTRSEHSLLELEGLGAEVWEGVDAQAYVNGLRKEWEHRP